jgi:hypothetical protein
MVAGPWFHGEWQTPEGDRIGIVPFGGHKTALEFRTNIEAAFFRYYLHGKGSKAEWEVTTFQTGSNTWQSYAAWPPKESKPTNLYLHADGSLSFAPDARGGPEYRQYVSDPANPVPYRVRPVSPTYPEPEWRTWEVADQRFVEDRPDVLTFESAPLDHDVVVTGPVAAALYASSSGTDSDFVVKLIDVYPNDYPDPNPNVKGIYMGGYQQLVRGEPFRGKFRRSLSNPEPFTPGKEERIEFWMPDVLHTFRSGHRIMVQIQSSWFPLVDRNPQQFLDIPNAKPSDFKKAMERVFRGGPDGSHLVVLTME